MSIQYFFFEEQCTNNITLSRFTLPAKTRSCSHMVVAWHQFLQQLITSLGPPKCLEEHYISPPFTANNSPSSQTLKLWYFIKTYTSCYKSLRWLPTKLVPPSLPFSSHSTSSSLHLSLAVGINALPPTQGQTQTQTQTQTPTPTPIPTQIQTLTLTPTLTQTQTQTPTLTAGRAHVTHSNLACAPTC